MMTEAEDMPDIAANSLSIAFGDFQRGYVVVDRIGIRTMRDPFSTKLDVIFYTTKRVGGGVQDFDVIKLLRVSVEARCLPGWSHFLRPTGNHLAGCSSGSGGGEPGPTSAQDAR